MDDVSPPLARTLKRRHVTMISVGGIIGSGLFLGSSAAITATGPAIVVSYVAAGLLVLIVMWLLGQLAVAAPGAGSFTEYIRFGLGDWAGFVSGWLYWIFWILAVAFEAIAAATILSHWLPISATTLSFVMLILMTLANLLSTRSYGETEFWLSTIKIGAVLLFILVGAWFIFRSLLETGATPVDLSQHGGFAPFGIPSIISGMVTVIFALVGAEIVTIAAAESHEPARAIARLTTTLIVRIMLFYVGSMLVIVLVVPWTEVVPGTSPFTLALDAMGTPGAATLMSMVVVVAALSCLNSGVYVCSRVLFGLAAKRDAPKWLVALDRRGVPSRSIIAGSAIGFAVLILSIWSQSGIFSFLLNATGTIMIILYLLVVAAYLASVKRGRIRARPGSVVAAIVAFLIMCTILVAMSINPDLSSQVFTGVAVLGVTLIAYRFIRVRRPS